MNEIITTYGLEIVKAIVVAIFGYVGIVLKNLAAKYVTSETIKKVVQTTVAYVEQVYKDIHGDDKLAVALRTASEILANKGIAVTDTELRATIEAAVEELNRQYHGKTA
nr:MAG TPA: holin [Caudoviricetes sp.]